MYQAKNIPSSESVDAYIAALADDSKRADSQRLREIMEEISGRPASLWAGSIIGFGSYHYQYASGHQGDSCAVGFSPRAKQFSVYITGGFGAHQDTLANLGKHKVGKGCLYFNRLADIDEAALRILIASSVAFAAEMDAASTS